jgi:hypothetical protein
VKPLIPNQFLFRFSLECPYVAKTPATGKRIVDLPAGCRLPYPGAMDGQRYFADVRLAWNEKGLGLSWSTRFKEEPIYGEPDRPTACDGLSLWLDTRDSRTIHRASRYCQRFLFLAHNGQDPPAPEAVFKPIHRALDAPPAPDLSLIRLAMFPLDADGDAIEPSKAKVVNYRMEVFLPAETLYGYDPETNNRLGVCYRVRDRELGDQLLAAGPEFPYWEDPSLWSTLRLTR